MKGILMMEDQSSFEGRILGEKKERIGEVILNTAVVGYQEIMTDPANAGKILVFTYPLIGNYGVARKFYESKRNWTGAIVIKEKSRIFSNWQAENSLDDFLQRERITAIADVDTRTLVVKIRDKGQMLGIISNGKAKKDKLLKKIKNYKKSVKHNYIRNISVKRITKVATNAKAPEIAILDLGILNSFIKQLKNLKCNVTLLPYNTELEKILQLNVDGLIISNGPEEDIAVGEVVKVVREIIGKMPILGISLGHEIIALALGAKLKKLKVGHRGVNYPVKSPSSYKGEITVQNHSFAVDENSMKKRRDVNITLHNVNDKSIEEMKSSSLKFISTQYYPVSPGFGEVNEVFKCFLDMVNSNKGEALICQGEKTYKKY